MELKLLLADLKACSKTRNLVKGKEIHAEAIESGHGSCIYVATALVKMYAKCGSMLDARWVFDHIKHQDVVLWTALISGYVDNGQAGTALDMFARMKSRGCCPDSFTFVAALRACACLSLGEDASRKAECLLRAKQIHAEIGCDADIYVQNTLIYAYANCGSISQAREVFENMKTPDVVSWSALILGYAENGESRTSLELFARMRSLQQVPSFITYIGVLKACSCLALEENGRRKTECLARGKQIHSEMGFNLRTEVQNMLIDMYAKCGSMVDARQVFDGIKQWDLRSWTALISGYAENEEGATALDLFARMRSQGYEADSVAFVAALQACSSLAMQDETQRADCLLRGRQIHLEIRFHSQLKVHNALIDMYSKCGSMADAHQVFESIKHPSVVSWTALMLGHVETGESATALNLFARMKSRGCAPSCVTYVAALKASAILGAVDWGRRIHLEIMDVGIELNAMLVTCLVDFYAKCGKVLEAQRVFDLHPEGRDIATWTALLTGYCRLGDAKSAFAVLERMQDAAVKPTSATLSCMLTCCSHTGLVERARDLFEAMTTTYGIAPTIKHYNVMVDIFCRSNNVDAAMALVRSMPCLPNAVTWMTLLDGCRKPRNIAIGTLAYESVVSLDGFSAAVYVLMVELLNKNR